MSQVYVVGGGLAGSECAFQLAEQGVEVTLLEMRPEKTTPAHKSAHFAELVCSNSFGSQTHYSAPGQLKWEAEKLNSLILKCAKEATVPAGMALSVDREIFGKIVTEKLQAHPLITIRNQCIHSLAEIPRPAVIATGPLTFENLAIDLQNHFDSRFLYFFDAIAPIVDADTINWDKVFKADRYGVGTSDYVNCPLTKEEYYKLVEEIQKARKIESKDFEKTPYFEGCMPIEVMAERGIETLRFGPLAGRGLKDPRSNTEPYAAVQLRLENREGTSYNMVGFQTKMAYSEQIRVFKMIPGLENAEFLKLGSIHRNLYLHSPAVLSSALSSLKDPDLYFAGQITGVEGYFESTCIGMLVAQNLARKLKGLPKTSPPRETALGSLWAAITEPKEHFQPTNINFGLFPKLDVDWNTLKKAAKGTDLSPKDVKKNLQIERAQKSLTGWLSSLDSH